MKSSIIKCNQENVNELQKISRKTFSETFGAQNSQKNLDEYLKQAYNKEKLLKEINNPNSQFYFIKTNHKIAGYLKLNLNDAQSEKMSNDDLEVERIYLVKTMQKLGLGRKLFDKAIAEAKKHHKKTIWLGVWEHNENGKAFYKHLGFKPFSDHVFQLGDDAQRDILMKKQV
ncbi:spermidine/spermine N(1)-acetyltransferase [Philodulcilactobacillus myokoensis]|uniref:Spermidine/spermine N(1)-acetyltransferase n=1 Tax=Philodulcilactobacillus myokoensis TaxID=2929573 RepID=A0A9W6ESW5_9LACO|nr:GNAT family N-acetyltransferase [Philodulcilactobacillus myokoensis]GLB47481.1 spermidine/spermine N(1)-acetyltransferase [Philodulcilactobacillus myokoensis]